MGGLTVIKGGKFGNIYLGESAVLAQAKKFVEKKSILLTDENVFAAHGAFLQSALPASKIFVIKAGEENKNFAVLQSVLAEMAALGLQRTSRLYAVGGGVVGDLGGLAAALYMRGVACVQVPTSLLAQVDSCLGGKTAVDFADVKNLVGAFHQPREVWIDPAFLRTLPKEEVLNGLGEIVKYAALDKGIFREVLARVRRGEALDDFRNIVTVRFCTNNINLGTN
jgi:3-dehydroquinate synthase